MTTRQLLTWSPFSGSFPTFKRIPWLIAVSSIVVVSTTAAIAIKVWQSHVIAGDDHDSANTVLSRASRFAGQDEAKRRLSLPTPVRVFVVGSMKSSASQSGLTGTVQARHEISLAFRVSGKILHRYVEVGHEAEKGELLFELDSEDFTLQLRAAQANLDVANASAQRAKSDEKRALELLRSNAISASEYEKSLSERDIAIGQQQSSQKQLELASNQLSYCRLLADQSGVITTIDAEAGQVVTTGSRVASLAKSGELEAVIEIPENRIPKLQGLEPTVRFWSLPSLTVRAKLREISPVADPLTRMFRSRFTLIDPTPDIKLGMTATVEWSHSPSALDMSIPTTAIFERDGQSSVWLVDIQEGTIAPKPVQIAMIADDKVIVSNGLAIGQTIVSAGVQKLDEKIRVRVWENLP